MPRFSIVMVFMAVLIAGGWANVAPAQEPCAPRPILRASAMLVRGSVRLVTAPVRLLVCHHGWGCGCHGGCHAGYEVYGPQYATDYHGAALGATNTASLEAAWLNRPAAIYSPVVAADSIERLSSEDRRRFTELAIDRGIGQYRQGEFAVAGQYFCEATTLTPDMAAAWGMRGVAAAANDAELAAECAVRVAAISNADASERSRLYRRLAPMQGESRAAFELLVRNTNEQNPAQNIARLP